MALNSYKYKATELIAKQFEDEYGDELKLDVIFTEDNQEILSAGYLLKSNRIVYVHFISDSDDTDVSIGIFDLISKVPANKRNRILEVCNSLNDDYRYFNVYIDGYGDVCMKCDMIPDLSDYAVGPIASFIFDAAGAIIDDCYERLSKALETDLPLSDLLSN